MSGEATAWPATCVAPAANGAPRAVHRPVDWRHLARSTCHGRHGEVPVVAAQGPVVAPIPRRARPTRVWHVQWRADVAARDIAAERTPVFQGVFNSLNQFSNAIFSKF
jgi:hypothetical protein